MSASDNMDWESLWVGGIPPGTRFDVSGSHLLLKRAVEAGTIPKGRALVPGCGRGYDLATLASQDRFVIGLDIAPTGVREAQDWLAANAADKANQYQVLCQDFFTYEPSEKFDFIYDLTFLCALPPSLRKNWASKTASLLKPGGTLITVQFPIKPFGGIHPRDQPPNYEIGPPYLLSKELYDDLLGENFDLLSIEDVPEEMSVPDRAGCEAFAVWKRK